MSEMQPIFEFLILGVKYPIQYLGQCRIEIFIIVIFHQVSITITVAISDVEFRMLDMTSQVRAVPQMLNESDR